MSGSGSTTDHLSMLLNNTISSLPSKADGMKHAC